MRLASEIDTKWRLSALLHGFATVDSRKDLPISGISLDSRDIEPGFVFLACKGSQSHGIRHAPEAIRRGAAAIVFEPEEPITFDAGAIPRIPVVDLSAKLGLIAARFYAEPAKALNVVGVTGTDGKTSVSNFVAQALGKAGQRCGLIGTLGHGFIGQLISQPNTTPDAVFLNATLARFREQGARAAALEVSSHALDQQRVAGLIFDVAVFTNLGRDHLDYHRDLAAYGDAKARLFVEHRPRVAVINADDDFGRRLLSSPDVQSIKIGYGAGVTPEGCDEFVCAESITTTAVGLELKVRCGSSVADISSRLLGRFNAYNLLATVAVLRALGLSFEQAIESVADIEPVAGRMEAFGGGSQPLVVVDYAHTPQALQAVLENLRRHCQGRLWCVFGCGGDRDAGKRPLMGQVAEDLADHVVLTDDNPRTEVPNRILDDILVGIAAPDRVTVKHDRGAAIDYAVRRAGAGDVVLIAGKGHEAFQLVGDRKLSFSDRQRVLALL